MLWVARLCLINMVWVNLIKGQLILISFHTTRGARVQTRRYSVTYVIIDTGPCGPNESTSTFKLQILGLII